MANEKQKRYGLDGTEITGWSQKWEMLRERLLLLAFDEGQLYSDLIVQRFGVCQKTASNWLNRLAREGYVKKRRYTATDQYLIHMRNKQPMIPPGFMYTPTGKIEGIPCPDIIMRMSDEQLKVALKEVLKIEDLEQQKLTLSAYFIHPNYACAMYDIDEEMGL
jgi:hypothetical protein